MARIAWNEGWRLLGGGWWFGRFKGGDWPVQNGLEMDGWMDRPAGSIMSAAGSSMSAAGLGDRQPVREATGRVGSGRGSGWRAGWPAVWRVGWRKWVGNPAGSVKAESGRMTKPASFGGRK